MQQTQFMNNQVLQQFLAQPQNLQNQFLAQQLSLGFNQNQQAVLFL